MLHQAKPVAGVVRRDRDFDSASLILLAGLGAMMLLLLAAPASGDDWLFFRGPNHDGKSAESAWKAEFPEAGPKIAWRKNVGIGASSVVVAGDRVVTMGNRDDKDVVTCLDADTGDVLWTFEYDCPFERRMYDGGTAATPTIDGDRVYTFSHNGDLHCLGLKDGKPIWKKHVREFGGRTSRWEYACSPLVMGDLVYVDIGGDRSTVALNKMNGSPYWGQGEASAGYAAPIAIERGDEKGVLVFKGDRLVAHDAETGEQWWEINWGPRTGVNASSPLLIDNRIFISCGYGVGGAMYDISGDQPKELWRNRDATTKISSCIHHEGHIYAINEVGRLLCIDDKTGDAVWSQRGFGSGTLSFADGKLIIMSDRGELVIAEANAKEFKAISRAQVIETRATCWVQPVLAHGRIYCKSNRGELVCVDVRDGSAGK